MPDQDEIFLARGDELDRFRGVLRQVLDGPAQPGRGYLVLVHGQGGIGKSTLLKRYRQIARGELPGDRGFGGRFLLAKVNWEELRRANPGRYPPGGPPLWVVLDDIYRAVIEAANAVGRGTAKQAARAFERFRGLAARAKNAQVTIEQGTPGVDVAEMVVGQLASLASLAPVPYASQAADAVKQVTRTAAEVTRRSRSGRISHDQYLRLTHPDDALVQAFTDGLYQLSAKRPIVLSIDTVEMLEDTFIPLSGAIACSGSKVAWLAGMRLENNARDNPIIGPFLNAMPSDWVRLIAPNRFTGKDIDDYLRETETKTGGRLPQEVTPDAVDRVTHGIPLAVQLVVESVRAGMAPVEALSEVTSTGEVSAVVRGLAERYLMHVRSAEASGHNPDLALIYGLALLEGTRDPGILAALWDIAPGQVGDTKDALRRRHDFVLAGAPWLHQEVRESIRRFLLDADERARVRPANERAAAALRTRLTEFGLETVEAQLGSEQWCTMSAALLWHTLWADDRQGLALLANLLPAAMLIRPEFGSLMLRTAAWFTPVFPAELRARVERLRALANVSGFMMRLRDMLDQASGVRAGAAPWVAAVLDDLARGTHYPDPVLADDVSAETLLDLLKVAFPHSCVVTAAIRAELVVSVDATLAAVNVASGRLSRLVGAVAEQLAISRFQAVRDGSTDDSAMREGLRFAEIAARRRPDRPETCCWLAWWQLESGDNAGALASADRAVRANPSYGLGHIKRGDALIRLGRFEDALLAYDEALRLDSGDGRIQHGRGVVLALMRRHEDSVAAYTRALELGASNYSTYTNRGEQLLVLGRTTEAIADLSEAIRLGSVLEARALLALAIHKTTLVEAESLSREVLELSKDQGKGHVTAFRRGEVRAWAHLILGAPDAAEAEMRAAAEHHQRDDTFIDEEYHLLADVPGIERLRAVWEYIR